jgi:hypothetical protein
MSNTNATTKQKEWEEFDKKWFELFNRFWGAIDSSILSGSQLTPRESFNNLLPEIQKELKTFISNQIAQAYDRGYFQGVKDETECIEASGEQGEHGEAVKKIRAQERKRIVEIVERMKEVDLEKCPECDGVGHLGHDMLDQRPEHIDNGDCQTCPVQCHACLGDGEVEIPNLERNKVLQELKEELK